VLAAAGLYFCWFLLFTPDYGMRNGLGSDQVLAVARVFIALFLRSDDSLLDACISDLSSIEKAAMGYLSGKPVYCQLRQCWVVG
jgi:hypothetical protein